MKRLCLSLLLALTLTLAACGTAAQPSASGQGSLPPGQTAQLPDGSVPAGAQPQDSRSPESAPAAGYTIERQDRSVTNRDGSIALSWYYDLVQLTGDTDQAQAINESLSGYCDSFFAGSSGELPLEKRAEDLWLNTMEAAVTQNGDGLLSVCMTRTLYMGGTASSDCLGYTYDLATGEELGLAGLTSQEADTLATTLREIVKAYVTSHPEVDWFPEAVAGLDSRDLEELPFYVDDGEIVLCFPTCDLAPGAYGPAVIPTGVIAEH